LSAPLAALKEHQKYNITRKYYWLYMRAFDVKALMSAVMVQAHA